MQQPTILFAHGAGAGASHPWMVAWTARLASLGAVHCFNYPYVEAGRKLPDRLPRLIEAHREELARLRKLHEGPLVLVGKSMGSRVGCHLAVEEADVQAVVCLGYPLVSRSGKVRDKILRQLRCPTLFVQGSRD